MNNQLPNIVIVGGGAGGLELATKLGHQLGIRKRAHITLIDKNRTHIWKPLLHEIATGSLDPSIDGVSYSAHAAKHGFNFVLGEFIGLDPHKKQLNLKAQTDESGIALLPDQTLNYDILTLAIGSISNDFNTPGVSQHCFFLDSQKQAERFQNSLLNNFTRVSQSANNLPNSQNNVSIAIVGGGATGVELSAELVHVSSLLKHYGFNALNDTQLTIHLIEAGGRLLPALPNRIAQAAKTELEQLGVTVKLNTKIIRVTEFGFITHDNELIEADLMLWAAGVKVADYIAALNLFKLNRQNQIEVDSYLRAVNFSDIFVLGDACCFTEENGSQVPPRAQAAHQMASVTAKNIKALIEQQNLAPFIYKDHGSLVNLSRFAAVGNLMGNLTKNSLFVEGKLARIMYISLYRMHQNAIHGPFKTIALWLAEKLMRIVRPKLKLH